MSENWEEKTKILYRIIFVQASFTQLLTISYIFVLSIYMIDIKEARGT